MIPLQKQTISLTINKNHHGNFRATVKTNKLTNGQRVEKGMTVDFTSTYGSPMSTNGGVEVINAFARKYGVDIKKAEAVSSSYIEVVKIN